MKVPTFYETGELMFGLQPAAPAQTKDVHLSDCDQFCVGGICVKLVGNQRTDLHFGSTLVPFRAVAKHPPDITMHVKWVDRLPQLRTPQLFDSGSVWQLFEDCHGFRFDFTTPGLGDLPYKRLVIDSNFLLATLQMSEEAFENFPGMIEPLEYPLDELLIMHRLTQEKAVELHSCGIVTADGIGNLFVGHSGAGKSTTTRLWNASQEVEILSDDRIIVRRDPSAGPSHEMKMYGTPWHGEAAFASPSNAPLKRIFVLEHGRGNVLTRLSPSQAVGELLARAFVPFHRHEYLDSALGFLHELVQAVPCYRYSFEPDGRAVDTILNFRD
jgi:hypothetical protein